MKAPSVSATLLREALSGEWRRRGVGIMKNPLPAAVGSQSPERPQRGGEARAGARLRLHH